MTAFDEVHARLRAIVLAHRGDLLVTRDEPAGMTLEVPGLEGKPWGMSPARVSASAMSAPT